MIKFCRSLIAFVLLSSLFTVFSTQTSNAGIETLKYCAVDFNRDVPLTETAFTYEVKYALGYDEELASYTTAANAQFPNAAGGVVTSDHSTLLGSRDATNAGLEIYYNTNYLNGKLLFYMGRPGEWHWFKNPIWKFPEFTRAQGSSSYIHIAVVRDAQRRLALYFNGVPATQSGTTATQGAVTYNNISYQTDNNNYSDVRYFGTSGSYTGEINPKAYVSNLRLVTGAALYSATADSITVPSTAALKLNADTGTTQVILNSRTPDGLLTNESNFDQTAATLYNFGGDQTAINNQIAVGAACTPTTGDAYIGGDGVYNVYFKEGNVSKDSGALPKKRDFYFSEDATPTPITIPTPGNMVKAQNEFVGWNTQADGYGQTYRPGALYRPTDNTTLYTKWSTRKTITYNDGGGTGTLPTESNKLWEDTFTVAANPLTNGVLIFNGWRDGANVVYGPGSIYTVPDNHVSLTAVWSGDTTISTANVTIAAPVAGATPVTSISTNGQYTTSITWSNTPVTFDYNTVYTATVAVAPVAGYTLTGVRANLFTINGSAPTTANSLNSGIFTYQFPRTALGPALNPTFDTPTAIAGGYRVTITNYDGTYYTWDTPTVSRGSVAVTSTIGSNRVLTVTGLSPGDTATITQTTSRTNYSNGSNTVTGTTLPPLNPTFGEVTRNVGGFSVPITNYDPDFTWDTPTVSSGSVAVTGTGEWSTNSNSSGSKDWQSITSSSDGVKLAAVVYGEFIYTSTDSGVTWTARADTQNRNWFSITSSSDGTKLAAIALNGYIYTSTDSGATWTARTSAGQRPWYSIASSSDGTKLAAVAFDDHIYTSTDTGATWTEQSIVGSQNLYSIASSSDGTKLAVATYNRYIYTFAPRTLTVTGLSAGDTATITQGTRRTNYPNGSNTVTGTAQVPLNPTFGSVTRTASGFSVSITNYDPDFTWNTPTVTRGSVAITSTVGATRVLTVTGLLASETSTITQATSRSNYPNGTNTVTGTALNAAYNPTFDTPTATGVGFSVSITNYDANYTWDTPTVSRGSVVVTSTVGAIRVLTVTGLSAGDTATITQTTSRDTYAPGSNTVTSRTLLVINQANVAITAPVTGATPVSSLISNGQYTTAIAWSGAPTTFAPNTFYTATVTVTPVTGYMLSGVGANFFTVNGNAATSANLANAGVFTYRFPETAIIVTTSNISITAPATGATPVASIASNGQYTTAITWSDSPARFAANTVYTATVTVTPITGYTLTGVAANLFRVNSDTATTGNLVNAGSFTYQFAATGAKLAQSISFTQPSDLNLTSSNQTLTATSNATGSYPVTLASTTTNTCTIESGAIHVVAAGICSVRATQAGDGIYLAAASVIRSIAITSNKFTQSITFTQPAAMNTRSANQALTATSSAGNSYPVTLTSNSTDICSISNRAIVVVKSGTCSITASQSGDGTYLAAASVTRTIQISKVAQTITFNQPNAMTVTSGDQGVSATSSAGGSYPVSFTFSPAGICTDAEGDIRVVSAGTCIITASQAGDDTYTAAVSVTRSVVISKLAQSINFSQPTAMTMATADQLLSATSSATGGSYPVSYLSTTTGVCTIVASNDDRYVHVVAPGTCSITASQLGNGTYAAATSVVKTLVVSKLAQSITFTTPVAMTVSSGDQTLSATSSAAGSLTVKFTSTTPAVCTIIGTNTLHAVSAGTCSITASQAGNATYAVASNVIKSFVLASARRK